MSYSINIDPENHQCLVETNLPTPKNGRVELLIYWRVIILFQYFLGSKVSSENGRNHRVLNKKIRLSGDVSSSILLKDYHGLP
jgi:hypothetical protein